MVVMALMGLNNNQRKRSVAKKSLRENFDWNVKIFFCTTGIFGFGFGSQFRRRRRRRRRFRVARTTMTECFKISNPKFQWRGHSWWSQAKQSIIAIEVIVRKHRKNVYDGFLGIFGSTKKRWIFLIRQIHPDRFKCHWFLSDKCIFEVPKPNA